MLVILFVLDLLPWRPPKNQNNCSRQIECESYVLASKEPCGVVLWLVCVTNQIRIGLLFLPVQ